MRPLTESVALVTGASSGIGAAVARRLAAQSCAAIVVNHRQSSEQAEAVAEDIRRLGSEALIYQADVSLENECREMVSETVRHFGHLDLLVNNAGTTRFIPHADLDAITDDIWREILGTNLFGVWYCARAAAEQLRASGGAMVNIASVAAHRAGGSSIPYGVSKAGVVQLTRALAFALAPEVRVNSVSPGLVSTGWVARKNGPEFAAVQEQRWIARSLLQRVVTPEDVADVVVSLLSAEAVTGQDVIVDTGQNIQQAM